MKVFKLNERGFEEAVLGFSLSYNSTPERAKQILPKYAHGISGERKFLESIVVWLDVTAPRYWWQEFDTYRVGVTKQSESTMHTLTKRPLTAENFEGAIHPEALHFLNDCIDAFKSVQLSETKNEFLADIKGMLPEGFLQRRIVMVSYKTLQNMYDQRRKHRLPQWRKFLQAVLMHLEHPEFIVPPETN